MSEINSKFKEFMVDVIIKTNKAITKEYNDCIALLKDNVNFY